MPEDIDIRVTPSLHPANVRELDGYDDTVSHLLGPTETAMSEAYIGIGQVHTAREAAKRNPTWNEAQQLIHTQDLADKVMQKVGSTFLKVRGNLESSIAALETELSAPITAKASHAMASEIRAYAKALGTGERVTFIQKAIADGDELTASSILGGPAYLSGFEAKSQAVFTRLWHERNNPDKARRVRVLTAANEMLAHRGGLLGTELEKAVGEKAAKVARLRKAKSAAEAAFILKEA